ncbi:F-box/LRR-repeat protein 6 [Entelurus aequoreus]|uniref:F-box/LRR-repeat protein 6 n=1 Tax=Entelurus aequoreus TaxID=161455 RepID=UPI002B1DC65C|nr:F-box/LRR-repeat protein 6 [Entelurus aequoreus]XP_061903138.1 F-box/LRR-repeat protein 6 [Entelurus aequoreus]XP_061903139.1 F-box/LRR-repeat protein 6 [Entelurus aequoreus]
MASSDGAPSAHSDGAKDADTCTSNTSGQEGKGEQSQKKASSKRKSNEPRKVKRQKRANRFPNYTVQEGEDMLFVISNNTCAYFGSAWDSENKSKKRKKPNSPFKDETSEFVPKAPSDHRWGQSLPEEVLINIFKMVVAQDGAVPFLCRAGRVCRLWNVAASGPGLWRKVSVGHCWIAPRVSQSTKTETAIKNTIDWLAQNRFSQLREFSLHHWTMNVDYAVDVVSKFCPHLGALTLSHCSGLTKEAFQSLGLHSRSLRSLNLQHTEFQVEGLLSYLESHGGQIREIWFTRGLRYDRLLPAISRGCCPGLELLEINTKLDSKDGELSICIQALQAACPDLKIFRMLNIRPLHKTMRTSAEVSLGFPLLEELCIATTSYSYLNDKDLWEILFGSPRLRVLDLRGCWRITPAGLAALPCDELECLFWGQYFSSHAGSSLLKKGLHMVTQKWNQTLQELDVANQLFSKEDLEAAMCHLAQATDASTLRSLNLSGTRISPAAIRLLIDQTTALKYLNLSSCRYLPRGLKRIYRRQEDIQQLLDKLE